MFKKLKSPKESCRLLSLFQQKKQYPIPISKTKRDEIRADFNTKTKQNKNKQTKAKKKKWRCK